MKIKVRLVSWVKLKQTRVETHPYRRLDLQVLNPRLVGF